MRTLFGVLVMTPKNLTLSQVETMTNHVARGWLEDGRIAVFRITDSTRVDIDAAKQIMTRTIEEWDETRPYTAIYDLTNPNLIVSPYTQKMMKEVRLIRPTLSGYVAVVVPRGLITSILKLFIRTTRGTRQISLFFTLEQAVDWLNSKGV